MTERKSDTAVLTYHRVTDGDRRGFYDLPLSRFKEQIMAIADRVTARTGPLHTLDDGAMHLVLSFDDGTADHFESSEFLSEHGLTGVYFVSTGQIGNVGRLNQAQIERMAAAGHLFGSHTVNHARLDQIPVEGVRSELRESRDVLKSLTGQDVEWFAPPGGYFTSDVIREAEVCGYSVIRSMQWGYTSVPLRGLVPCFPIIPASTMRSFKNVLTGNAPTWMYGLKSHTKAILGESRYIRLRDYVSRFRRWI